MRSASRAVPSTSVFTRSVVRALGGTCAAALLLAAPAAAAPEERSAPESIRNEKQAGLIDAYGAETQSALVTSAFRGLRLETLALAQAPAAEPAPRPVKVLVGADIPSSYFFRGYRQEVDPAFTFQPYVDVGVTGDAASFNVGLWNSLHTGSLKDNDAGWYETDFYAAATVGMVKATYTAYMYPQIDDSTIHELMLSATFPGMLAPSAAVAFEFAKPEGVDKGIYLELGIAPAIPLGDDAPVSLTIPVKLGLSLKDYYGEDTFGYVSGGLTVGRSISDNFEVHGGVTVYGFGDTLKAVNDDTAGQFIGSVGFSVSY